MCDSKFLQLVIIISLKDFFVNTFLQNSSEVTNIIGGYLAQEGEIPYQVSLQHNDQVFCGGAIIGRKHVLTAAHCCLRMFNITKVEPFDIVAGINDLDSSSSSSEERVVMKIRSVYVHELYTSSTYENDICLIKLRECFKFNKHINRVCLRKSGNVFGKKCKASGWGLTHQGSDKWPDLLRAVYLPVLWPRICKKRYRETQTVFNSRIMICATDDEGGKDTCQGDSGGGLVCDGLLTGIVSWGISCAIPEYPGVYTKVRAYINWLKTYGAPTDCPEDVPKYT